MTTAKFVPHLKPEIKTPAKTGYEPMEVNYHWYSTPGDATSSPLAKNMFNFTVLQANPNGYFQYGIAPLCIFCTAVFAIFWGTLAGILIRKINMDDYKGVEDCIKQYEKSAETIKKAGLKPQEPAPEVMKTLKAVGIRITNGAKAFLHKEYIYLTIWSCCFAIILGSTVDLLEMQMPLAPTNFPYTALSFLTGSITSIFAGYIGMRVAVYTNTRVTFQCCSSVHQGFVTAFRGGQVLGFVLVGGGVMNIMIIIFIFKAGWYNEWLQRVIKAGQPQDNCPAGNHTAFVAAQTKLNDAWTLYVDGKYLAFANAFVKKHTTWCTDGAT